MEKYIKGKFKKIIYQNEESNYVVALFKVEETNDELVIKKKGKDINVTGIIPNIKLNVLYNISGKYINHQKYSWQFICEKISAVLPTKKDDIKNFLASPFIEGCSKQMAQKIVDAFGEDTLNIVKTNPQKLLEIKGMTELKMQKINVSFMKIAGVEEYIQKLINLGFSYEESSKIINKYYNDLEDILNGNIYLLKNIFDFKKLDLIYKNNFDPLSPLRCKECILNTLIDISFNEGSTFTYYDNIYRYLTVNYEINLDNEKFNDFLEELINLHFIIKVGQRYYLKKYFDEEKDIARYLFLIDKQKKKSIENVDKILEKVQKKTGKIYSEEQLKAIKNSLKENISIISGGPGTGKTTIINAIVKTYIDYYGLSNEQIITDIALLAPTGRASKKMSQSTGMPSYTIHRLLKWHKDDDSFEYNENNKLYHKLIIVDECSMIDVSLFKSLLCAYNSNIKLVLVGDIYQLPSVGPGLILHDLITSDLFSFNFLNTIYRQSDDSYIPYLAKDIKMQSLEDDFINKKDDYSFIISEEENIKNRVVESAKYALSKGIDETKLQVLAPMYKGINGIDSLNEALEKIYNPFDTVSVSYGDKKYKVNDKVLQLINDADNNVFNGDIGKIMNIIMRDGKTLIQINFDETVVFYEKKDLKNITLAYAISIHKSQGSEFENVIMPICNSYSIMLYNKLLYTAVSRAKKTLTIIGDPRSFIKAMQNNYAKERNTSLKDFLNEVYDV